MICARAKSTERSAATARDPLARAAGHEGFGGVLTRRSSFWLAVSGSGRRVAFHETDDSRGVVFADLPFPVYTRESVRERERERIFRYTGGCGLSPARSEESLVHLSFSLSLSRFGISVEVKERQLTRS